MAQTEASDGRCCKSIEQLLSELLKPALGFVFGPAMRELAVSYDHDPFGLSVLGSKLYHSDVCLEKAWGFFWKTMTNLVWGISCSSGGNLLN